MNTDPAVTELTTVFARIHGMLLSQEAATSAIHQLAQVARDLIPSAAGAGVSVLDAGGTRITAAATDPVVGAADDLQYELGEGPCLSAWASTSTLRIDDTATDTHWPTWSAAVLPLGVRSVLSTPLIFRGETLGAMKVYTTAADAFSATDERMLTLLATAAATLLAGGQTPDAPHRLSAALQAALSDRQTVDVATGILIGRRELTEEQARRLLLDTARTHNRPLLEIARQLLAGGTDPTR